ncbi:MAG: DUF3105 domain-containing protein [Kofleriaceae bacterium]
MSPRRRIVARRLERPRSSAATWSALALTSMAAACGDDLRPSGGALGTCDGQVFEIAREPGLHVLPGQTIEWSSNPPATGAHYPLWAAWYRTYDVLPRGYWVHNAEHGGIVLLTRCPDGCEEDRAALIALAQRLPVDGRCQAPIRTRVILASDPELPEGVRVAAVAWGAYYTASCVDEAALTTFIQDHYARAPEDLCGDGLVMGGVRIP